MVLPTPCPATNKQDPNQSIMDQFNKQVYLGNAFIADSDVVSLSDTSEVPLIYIANASTNSRAIFNNLRELYCDDVTGLTGVIFRVYFNAGGVSGGTAKTPRNLRPANPNISVASVLVSPTASSKGTLISTNLSLGERLSESSLMMIIDPGQNMLITAQATASSNAVADLSWYEL